MKLKIQAFKVNVGDAAGYALNLTLSPEDEAHISEINECLQHLGATLRSATKEGDNTLMAFDVVARDINSFKEHLITELNTIMASPAPVTEVPAEKTANRSFNMELIWNKQSFMAVKEKMAKDKYALQGEVEKLDLKPTAPTPPTSQKTDKAIGGQFVEQGEKESLQYPKVKKESTMAINAAQQLPGSDSIDAGSVIEKGEKEKLQFPTKAGPDPKIKMQGLDVSNDAKKSIDGGEKGKIQHGQTKGKDIKIEWQVNTDTAIGAKFQEQGDKGGIKTVSGPAKEPGVSAQKESGADANIERGEATSGMQKQFSLNFKRASAEEKEVAVTTAIDNAILEIEVAASKCGVNITATRLAPIYTGLIALKEGVRKNGSLFAMTPAPVAPAAAPIKVQASAHVVDMDAAAIATGARIF